MISSSFLFTALPTALAGGVFPALIWLWFWLKEDRKNPEPKAILALTFLVGMAVIVAVLPLESLVVTILNINPAALSTSHTVLNGSMILLFMLWASIEEIAKYIGCSTAALHSKYVDEPIDPVIYMMTTALGFAALENTLFILQPAMQGNLLEIFTSDSTRFIGANLLHVLASATIGVFIALSFKKSPVQRVLYTAFGIISAIALHTAFNLFIIKSTTENVFLVFLSVWVGIVALLIVIEKIKRIPYKKYYGKR